MARVVEKFRTYGRQDVAEPDLEFGGDRAAGLRRILGWHVDSAVPRPRCGRRSPRISPALDEVRTLLDGPPAAWRVREVGDGNLNLVFIVEGRTGSVCVKQALPYVRVAGPGWPMSPRARLLRACLLP